jgi:hypothetical protein
MRIQVDRDRLTVQLKEAPLKAVLEEIGRRAGVKMIIQAPLTRTISTEFRDLPLEQCLERLLRDCGVVLITGYKGTTLEQVVVVSNDASVPPDQRQGPSSPISAREPEETPPDPPARTLAALAERKAIKSLFDTILHNPDSIAKLDAFGEMVNEVQAGEVSMVLQMLQAESVQPAEWDVALAPLADVVSEQERRDIVRSLQTRANREYLVKMLEQVHLFKTMTDAEKQRR